jgi:hypothetical protein
MMPPTLSERRRRPADEGYILLFVLGLLVVVATLVLGTSTSLRIDAQLLARKKDDLQDRYLLEGAAHVAAVQLGVTRMVEALQLPPDAPMLRDVELWRTGSGPYSLTLDGRTVEVSLQEAGGLPDANLLTEVEWSRLLLALGAPTPVIAQEWASVIARTRRQLIAMRGGAGFETLRELLEMPLLPREVVEGGTERTPIGLADLVIVGPRSRTVDLDHTPLILFNVLGQVSPEKLQALTRLRAAGPIPQAQAAAWLQGTNLTVGQPAGGTSAVIARMALPSGVTRVAVIAGDNTGFRVVDWPASRASR